MAPASNLNVALNGVLQLDRLVMFDLVGLFTRCEIECVVNHTGVQHNVRIFHLGGELTLTKDGRSQMSWTKRARKICGLFD